MVLGPFTLLAVSCCDSYTCFFSWFLFVWFPFFDFFLSFLPSFLPSFPLSLSLSLSFSAANLGAAHAKVLLLLLLRQTQVNAVFIQQTMRVAQADQELIIKQRISCLTAVMVSDLRACVTVRNRGVLKWGGTSKWMVYSGNSFKTWMIWVPILQKNKLAIENTMNLCKYIYIYTYIYIYIIPVQVSLKISGRLTPWKRTDFLDSDRFESC